MMKKKKAMEQMNSLDGYDGYYSDVLPEDANEQVEKSADKSVIANVSVVAFVCILIVAAITVFLTAF